MRHTAAAVALAALVVLGGCSTLGLGGGTPTSGDEDPTPTGPLPPGVEADGDVNETRLVEATAAAMNETAWRLRHRNNRSRRVFYGDGAVSYVRDRYGATWSSGNQSVTNGSTIDTDLWTSYDEGTMVSPRDTGAATFALGVRLATADFEWTGTKTVDGTRLHELTMTGAKNVGQQLDHYTGRMLVDEQGRIHLLEGEVGANESAAVPYRFAFEWGVDGIPRPDWVDAVPRLKGELAAGGHALAIEVTGGTAIPAGTELTVHRDGEAVTVTLDDPLAPGETLYVGMNRSDGRVTPVVGRDPPSAEGLVDLSDGQVNLRGRYDLGDGRSVSVSMTVGQRSY